MKIWGHVFNCGGPPLRQPCLAWSCKKNNKKTQPGQSCSQQSLWGYHPTSWRLLTRLPILIFFFFWPPLHSVMMEMQPWPHGPLVDILGPKYRRIPVPGGLRPNTYGPNKWLDRCRHRRFLQVDVVAGVWGAQAVLFALTDEWDGGHWVVYLTDKKCVFKSHDRSLCVPGTRVSR